MSERDFNISLRRDSHGGGLLSELEGTAAAFSARTRMVLLFHGYNLSRSKADAVYAPFKAALLNNALALIGQIGFAHWPGDASFPVISEASYLWRVRTAIQCSPDLARYIEERVDVNGYPTQVVIIAHSLGCRLAIEALLRLAPERRKSVRLIMMAAAYPVALAEANSATLVLMRPMVFYSRKDWVLSLVFPLGEMIRGQVGPGLPEAVGHAGLPADGTWSMSKEMVGYQHGTYWNDQGTTASLICAALGLPATVAIVSREIPDQPVRRRSLPERDLPDR